jgi:ABC-2 type transport system ATP-binding protein
VLVKTDDVTMNFGSFTAVDSVSIGVDSGEVVGLLGPNGAGKTTLIRLLLGLLRPSNGDVRLFGATPSTSTRQRVGYVPQSLGLYVDMTVAENWRFTSSAFGLRNQSEPEGIRAWDGDLVGEVSLGVQRQVAFAVALSHHPELLVLDEPTSGVGPLARARLWEQIRAAADSGTGALVTTHNMEEAEQCDRLVVMLDGRVGASGTVEEIVGDRRAVEVRCANWQQAFKVLDEERVPLGLASGALRVMAPLEEVQRALSRAGIKCDLSLVPANLEESFVAIVSGCSDEPHWATAGGP